MINKVRIKAKTKIKHHRSLSFRTSKQQGFTLIELLVVVSILASLAGLASVAMDGYQQDAEEKITRVEMQRIANAIRKFKIDTGYWPKTEVDGGTETGTTNNVVNYGGFDAANFNFLFKKPDADMQDWSPEYAIGWHGPYINLDAIKAVTIDTFNSDLGCSGNEDVTHVASIQAVAVNRINGLVDRFQQIREKNTGQRYCVLAREKNNPSQFKVAEFSASPYLYEADYSDASNSTCSGVKGCVALRSFGSDGIDNDGADVSDDIVFVLEVN